MPNQAELSILLREILASLQAPGYIAEICQQLASPNCSRKDVERILNTHQVPADIHKTDTLHLVIAYIKYALQDEVLTETEMQNVKWLKRILGIQPGDFIKFDQWEIEQVIDMQIARWYSDNSISDDEAIFKTQLQELFDLSYDQMNEYAKSQAIRAMIEGADPLTLDIFLSNKEYFRLRNLD